MLNIPLYTEREREREREIDQVIQIFGSVVCDFEPVCIDARFIGSLHECGSFLV